jgi:hypothetical protein
LPEYIPGIPAAKIACLSALSFVYIGVGTIIATVRRNVPYIIAIALALLATWVLGGIFIRCGYGIMGVAWAKLLATTALCVFTVAFAYRITGRV